MRRKAFPGEVRATRCGAGGGGAPGGPLGNLDSGSGAGRSRYPPPRPHLSSQKQKRKIETAARGLGARKTV